MRIGVLGGTFDPPHVGHVALALAAMETLGLDEVLWVPANRNPLKQSVPGASAADRLEMARCVAASHPKFAVTDIELQRGGPSYTVNTLAELNEVHAGEYWLILGLDAVLDLPKWKNYHRIIKLARIACALRNAANWDEVSDRIEPAILEVLDRVPMPPVEASSTEIRNRILEKRPISSLVTPEVLALIRQRNLYGMK